MTLGKEAYDMIFSIYLSQALCYVLSSIWTCVIYDNDFPLEVAGRIERAGRKGMKGENIQYLMGCEKEVKI